MSQYFDENKNSLVLAELKSLGLSEKEGLVYLSLLTLGEVGSSKIIKDTSLHGQYVYTVLSSLEEKGLVQHFIKNGRKKFSVKNSKILSRLAEQQKNKADELAEKLASIMVLPPQQEYEIFQGQASYIAHEFELLEKASTGTELLIIGGSGDDFINSMGHQLGRYERIREEKKIQIRYLGSEDQKDGLRKSRAGRSFFEFAILPGLFTGKVNTNIWQTAIGFNIFGDPLTSFVVSNPIVAGSYRQFFETLWKLGKK